MNNLKVDTWKVTVIKHTYNSDGTAKEEEVESNKLPSNINYLFIPVEYRKQSFTENYRINVSGFDASGYEIVTEKNIYLNDNNVGDDFISENGQEQFLPTGCRKTCIGAQYAYNIEQYKKPSVDATHLQLEVAYKAFDPLAMTANPYYWYTQTPFVTAITPVQFTSGPPGYVTVTDPAGNPLIGLVFGYPKTLGIWASQNYIATSTLTIGNEFCGTSSYSLNTAIILMNNYTVPALNPQLDCIGGTPSVGTSGPSYGDVFIDCYDSLTGFPEPCFTTVGGGFVSPDVVPLILISDLNNNEVPIKEINVADLYNTNGEFLGLNLTLPPSLYSFGFIFAETGYWAKIGELRTKTVFSVAQADMLDVNVFPNPMAGDNYSIEMKAFATLKFDYELRDFTGALITTKNFTIHKDHEKTQRMNEKNIPEGFLVHRFIFEDGSVKTIQTIKN